MQWRHAPPHQPNSVQKPLYPRNQRRQRRRAEQPQRRRLRLSNRLPRFRIRDRPRRRLPRRLSTIDLSRRQRILRLDRQVDQRAVLRQSGRLRAF